MLVNNNRSPKTSILIVHLFLPSLVSQTTHESLSGLHCKSISFEVHNLVTGHLLMIILFLSLRHFCIIMMYINLTWVLLYYPLVQGDIT